MRILFADDASAGSTGHGRARPRSASDPRSPPSSFAIQFVRRGLSEGWDLRLSVMPRSDMACFPSQRPVAKVCQAGYPLISTAPQTIAAATSCSSAICAALPAAILAGAQPEGKSLEEIRQNLQNYALKSIDAVRTKLKQAILYIERNPKIVKSITSFPYIRKSS